LTLPSIMRGIRFIGSAAILLSNVAHGSLADKPSGLKLAVCPLLPPKSGQTRARLDCPLSAICGHSYRRLLDLALANPASPSWSLHFKPVGKFRVPFRAVHGTNQFQLRRIDESSGAVDYKLILDMSVNDLTSDYCLVWAE
jgi:hypothetical protein